MAATTLVAKYRNGKITSTTGGQIIWQNVMVSRRLYATFQIIRLVDFFHSPQV